MAGKDKNVVEPYVFDFEKLEVYKKALDFAGIAFTLSRRFAKDVQYSLGDQLRRAALSVCNNIAEGSGQSSSRVKCQFYGVALHSARECIPVLTLAQRQEQLKSCDAEELRERCVVLCRMLGKLIKSVRSRS